MDEASQQPTPDPRLGPEQRALVAMVAPRVPRIARSMRHLLGGLSFDECESAGYEALVRAVLRYDPAMGVPFSAYSYPRVRGAMLDAARQVSPDRRRLARAIRALEGIDAAGTAHSAPALAGDPRSLAERVQAAAAMVREATMAVVMARSATEADPERVADSGPAVDELLVDAQTRAQVIAVIGRCEPDERELIEAIYFNGQSMHDYAVRAGVHVSTVSRRHARLLRKLSTWLGEAPP
jgi:RNA polymerase sigma factor for flagellar operon FliA